MQHLFKIYLYSILAALAATLHVNAAEGDPDLSASLRFEAAKETLTGQPHMKAVYVKGLVCSSCGIGLRIHLKKIPEIDRKQLAQGVALDVDAQLVTVAIRPGEIIDMARVRDAIYKAGYDPVHYFELGRDGVQRVEF